MTNHQLTKDILQTVARFDLFDYPLTDFELWQFLPNKYSYKIVKSHLKELPLLKTKYGFFFLPTRDKIVALRQNRYRFSEQKIKIAQQRLKLITWLPGLKFIALANIIGPNNLKAEADLDLFIITAKNRLWLVKLGATIILKLTGLRPTPKKVKNKLCLSFLVDTDALDLTTCRLGDEDWYFTYWLAGLKPLWGEAEVYLTLLQANPWLKHNLPNWSDQLNIFEKIFKNKNTKAFSGQLGKLINQLSQKLHEKLMAPILQQTKNKTSAVIINDHILKLHSLDRRANFIKQAEEKIKQLI